MKKLLFWSLVASLFIISFSLTLYKVVGLGFSLTPSRTETTWSVQAKVQFKANGGPVKAQFFVPNLPQNMARLSEQSLAAGYSLNEKPAPNGKFLLWSNRDDNQKRTFYYRLEVFEANKHKMERIGVTDHVNETYLPVAYREQFNQLHQHIHQSSADVETFMLQSIKELNRPNLRKDTQALLTYFEGQQPKVKLLIELLRAEKIPFQLIQGLTGEVGRKNQPMLSFIEVEKNEQSNLIFDPEKGLTKLPTDFIIWQKGHSPILEVTGANDSNVSFTLQKEQISKDKAAKLRLLEENKSLATFSLMTLPLDQQQAFRLLLLIPIGCLIMVFLRIVIGLTTSGTFMPILFALAFQQTNLTAGLLLFALVLVVGIWIRSLLTHLNLLLVARIAACVIVVIFIMATIAILSYNLGLESGQLITFFPVIILAWTVERMFIQWEESGAHEALKKIGASLLVTIIIYVAFNSLWLQHLMFYFPEQILTILSLIILLGNYTGFRLLELFRFSSFEELTADGGDEK